MAACLPPVLVAAASLASHGHTPLGLAAAVACGWDAHSAAALAPLPTQPPQVCPALTQVSSLLVARSMAGSASGAQVALSLDEESLRRIYMASLVVLGGRSFVSAAGNANRLLRKVPVGK